MATLPTLPASHFGIGDSARLSLSPIEKLRPEDAAWLRIAPEITRAVLAGEVPTELLRRAPDALEHYRRLRAVSVPAGEQAFHLVDVVSESPILSNTPFALTIRFQNFGKGPVVLISARVNWAGEPFVVQQRAGSDEQEGALQLNFGDEQTLPVGQAEFEVTLYREDGAAATFRRSIFVLPGNPLSLSLGPAGARVTGSWSARGDYHPENDTFLTEVQITIANGDGAAVAMNRRVNWEYWDGPVGSGTRIEAGNFDWNGMISVPAHGTWSGSCWFSSPRGSGIFGVYDRKEDMAVSISMSSADGRVIRGEITARVMLEYGVNIIKVGDFGSQEHVDLYGAVDRMRQIYEQRDITLSSVGRYIINNSLAGSYTTLNSEDEYRDMLEDWSVPNGSVDVFVVQAFAWGGYDGFAGDTPGPASKGGRKDGVAVDKTSFVDASGTQRLDSATLAQLIGHEVGHYLGLEHQETTNNLMRSNTGNRGPLLDYEQYRKVFPHGYVHYE
jgi:hypothetical protein